MKLLERPRRPWRRRILVALAVLSVCMFSAVGWCYWHGSSVLRAAIAAAKASDPYWRSAEYEEHRIYIPDTENSAIVIQAGAGLVTALPPNEVELEFMFIESFGDFPNHRANDQQIDALRQLLAPYQAAFGEWDKLRDMPRGRPPVTRAANQIGPSLPYLTAIRTTAYHGFRNRLYAEVETGDITGAVDDIHRIFNTAHSLGDERSMNSLIVHAFIDQLAASTCETTLARFELSEARLAQLQELARQAAAEPLLESYLRDMRSSTFEGFEYLKTGGLVNPQVGLGAFGPYVRFLPGFVENNQAAGLRLINLAVEQHEKLLAGDTELLDRLEQERNALPSLAQKLIPGPVSRLGEKFRRHQAMLQCLHTALAAERFRAQTGQWPTILDELVVRKLIVAVPLDPFDGQPLRWKQTPDGYLVYSVGPDSNDDGGQLAPTTWPTGSEPPSDIVFRLFNPDQRNLPPQARPQAAP